MTADPEQPRTSAMRTGLTRTHARAGIATFGTIREETRPAGTHDGVGLGRFLKPEKAAAAAHARVAQAHSTAGRFAKRARAAAHELACQIRGAGAENQSLQHLVSPSP
ncbi:MAG: hypothetical protein M3448_08545 [Pseudomonadota bacterium]|nr:hypothetical protein [Pseudomonadota bacterium]